MIDIALLARARRDLVARANALGEMQFGPIVRRSFTFQEIQAGFERGQITRSLQPELGQHMTSPTIYRLKVNNQDGANRLRNAFAEFVPDEGHKLTRNNNVLDSTTIYVGSSQKIGNRLQQHLGCAARSTYALKMSQWCPDADFSVDVEISTVLGTANPSQVQDVEDTLWRVSRPMFGKLGSK